MDQVAIGVRIKAARERVHLTQEQLAEIEALIQKYAAIPKEQNLIEEY